MESFIDQIRLLVATCIREELDPFVERVVAFLSDEQSSKWITTRAALNLKQIYFPRPPRGGNRELRAVMWTPRILPDRTAFYINSEDGWGHFFGKLSQAGGPETVSIQSSLPSEGWGVQKIVYRRPGSTPTKPTRLLQWLEEDDGYRLVQIGEPLSCEQSQAKDRNPIATRDDLLSFTRNFGIDFEDREFWKSDNEAVYLNQKWLKPE